MAEDIFGIVGTTQAGAFHVDAVVAEGGFAVVYHAQHKDFRAPVALKCLKTPASMTEAQKSAFLDKFRTEGELAFHLSSRIPAIVRPLQIGTLDVARFAPFLAMEWLDGEALDQISTRRKEEGAPPFELAELIELLAPIARALHEVHDFAGPEGRMSIIHRDLKPENIFVAQTPAGPVMKLLDFGIARMRNPSVEQAGQQERDDAAAFTPGYAAPEQWAPKRFGATGPWTDVYGLAMLMVEELSGRSVSDGEASELMAIALDPNKRPTPASMGVRLPTAIEGIFTRALALDPGQRTQTIQGFWTALERALGIPPTIPSSGVHAAVGAPISVRQPALRAAAIDTEPLSPVPASRRNLSPARGTPAVAPPIEVHSSPRPRPVKPVDYVPLESERPKRSRSMPPQSKLKAALRMPLALFFAGIAIAVIDNAITHALGEPLALAGIRPVYIGALVALVALVVAVLRIIFLSG